MTAVAEELEVKHAEKRSAPNKEPTARKLGKEISSTKVRLPQIYLIARGNKKRINFWNELDPVFCDNPGKVHFHGKNGASFPAPEPLLGLILAAVRLNQTKKEYILKEEEKKALADLAVKKKELGRVQRKPFFWQGKCNVVSIFVPHSMVDQLEQLVIDNANYLKLDDKYICSFTGLPMSSFTVADIALPGLYNDMLDWVFNNPTKVEETLNKKNKKAAVKKAEKEGTTNVVDLDAKQKAALKAEKTDKAQEKRALRKAEKALLVAGEGLSAEKTAEALELSKKLTDLFAG